MDTYSDFLEFLNKNKNNIIKSLDLEKNSEFYRLYQEVFDKNFIDFNFKGNINADVAATDSSEFVRTLYNGKSIIIIRAYTIYGEKFTKDFFMDTVYVDPLKLRNFTILLMENSEHLSIIKLLETEKPEYIFIDGSFKGRISHLNEGLDIENYDNFMDIYFKNLKKMLQMAFKNNVRLIFISKSNYSQSFKEFLLENLKPGMYPDEIVKKAKKEYTNDHLIIKSLAHRTGYTTPLIYRQNFSGTDVNYISFDVLPRADDLPMKVQIVSQELMMETKMPARIILTKKFLN
ncbi:DNA double-strand break repair nuclease NurA [Acidiplasma cupricumulans]|uniref:DNA double-strand break repair nuclease NurA n=1 Tax=Acidiplasma cupricumulans TaxID=312540 RepID=UPI00078235D0|nr:DNA double-strand break repair nuclease NurA [Acidiplasma cupricumulans]